MIRTYNKSAIVINFFILSLSIVLFFLGKGEQKTLLVLLPVIYAIFYIFLSEIHRYIKYPGMFILNVICIIRYIIIPTIIIIYPDYSYNSEQFIKSGLLMVYEALFLGVFLIFITRKYYKGKKMQEEFKISIAPNYLLKLIVIYSIIVIIINPSVLLQYNFVFANPSEVELISKSQLVTGLNGIVVDWGKLLIPLLLSTPLVIKYKASGNRAYYHLTIIIILTFNVMMFSGTSRNSVIMPAVSSIFFLTKAFPDKRRKIFIMMSILIAIVTLQLTFLKTEYLGTRTQMSLGSIAEYLEIYFAGPKNIEVAINTKENYASFFSVNTVLNDIFGNFPGLSQFFNTHNRTSTFFNMAFYNGGLARDQIIPSIGQGLFYFGYIFSILPQLLIVFGMAIFDSKFRMQHNLSGIYFSSYFAVRFGFTYIQDVSIILSFIYYMVLPMSIILLINRYVNDCFTLRR